MLPRPGEVFEARYRIVEVLGEGGFATVFRAVDSGRDVALKILKPEKDGYARDVQSRFTREVQVLANLRDPHTVRLFDHGRSQNGLLFMVFEFIGGRDLSDILAESDRLPASIAVRVLRQVALSLREAHANGLLHRDLKPANVLVYEYAGDPWRVKLLDFGIARPMFAADSNNITKTGELIGTPRYMSPEQLMGADLGPPSDIYSLGLVGLELLMGSKALAGNSWGQQLDRLHSGYVFSIPEMERAGIGLVSIIQRMSARRIEDRYQSMDEVLAAFDAVERGEPIPAFQPRRAYAPPGSTASQSVDPSAASQSMEVASPQDTRSLVVIAAGLLALVLVAVLGVWWVIERGEPERPPPQVRKQVGIITSQTTSETSAQPASEPAATIDAGTDVFEPAVIPGCGGTELAGSLTTLPEHVAHVLYVPITYDATARMPLVVAFHEDWQTPERFLRQTELLSAAEERGYVLLAPQGAPDLPWRAPRDIDRIGELVEAVQEQVCIDPQRVFLLGHGSGGTAANLLSCEGWAAALVTTSYRPPRGEPLCSVKGLPHLQFHAMLSNRMPVDGGGTLPCAPEPKASIVDLERMWLRRNSCSKRQKAHFVDAPRSGKCVKFECEKEFVSCRLDGGHGFPGGVSESPLNQLCDEPVADFPARKLIFDFLDAHPKD